MRAMTADQAVAAFVVLEDDEVFAEQPDRLHRPVAGQLIDQRGGLPVAAQQLPAGVPGAVRVMRSFCSALNMTRRPRTLTDGGRLYEVERLTRKRRLDGRAAMPSAMRRCQYCWRKPLRRLAPRSSPRRGWRWRRCGIRARSTGIEALRWNSLANSPALPLILSSPIAVGDVAGMAERDQFAGVGMAHFIDAGPDRAPRRDSPTMRVGKSLPVCSRSASLIHQS